jgi:hypothetical protein
MDYPTSTLASLATNAAASIAEDNSDPTEAVLNIVSVARREGHEKIAYHLEQAWEAVAHDADADPFMVAVQARMLLASVAFALAL